jgi:fermentation-respiration switch protein FrsA (DUF1100 family)
MDIKTFVSASGITAYKQISGNMSVGLFFLSGHSGTFESPIRHILTDFAVTNAVPLTHFTYFGRDQSHSENVPENGVGYVQHRLEQALALFDAVTSGPQILVGSSMGGYLALALAHARPERVKGIVGLAAGFGVELIDSMHEQYQELRVGTATEKGFLFEAAADNSLPITTPLNVTCPVRLAHAIADEVVSYKNTTYIANAVATDDVIIRLTKTGPHHLDRPGDNAWLEVMLLDLLKKNID